MPYEADRCLIARAENACWRCGAFGAVVCLVLPHDLKTISDSEDDDLPVPFDGAAVMQYVEQIEAPLLAAINLPTFKPGTRRTAAATYYANHCEHCDALLGDHYLHHPDGPFWPMSEEDTSIELTLLEQPVSVRAGSCSTVTFTLGQYELAFDGPPPTPKVKRRAPRKKA